MIIDGNTRSANSFLLRNKDAQTVEAVGQVGNINYGGLAVPCQSEI